MRITPHSTRVGGKSSSENVIDTASPIFGCRALRRTLPANSPLERMTRSGVGIGVGAAFDLVSGTT